jgi:hypothetical protein
MKLSLSFNEDVGPGNPAALGRPEKLIGEF